MTITTWEDSLSLSATSRAVAIEVLVHGAQSRARLSERMGLSAGSLTRLVKPLLAAGVLIESDAVRASQRGRYSLPLDVVPENYRFIGVKLTTQTAYAVATDLRARVLDKVISELPSHDVAEVTRTVTFLIDELKHLGHTRIDSVGVTVGGQVAKGAIVADSPYLDWHDVPFRSLLEQRLGVPVHLDNDVVGLTRAQHWFGSGKGQANFALLTVGAGIGYGLVINDEMVRTPLGPISHFPADPGGPMCSLGHRGCLSAVLTTAAITRAASLAHHRDIGYDEVLRLAEAGDPAAVRIVHEAARALGRATAAVTALTGVERIILSGEGVHLAEMARGALDEGMNEYQAGGSSHPDPVIHPVDFFEWARGAAVVAIQEEFPPSNERLGIRAEE
ncbi:ROK family protein [Lysobacter korlensis]|uniref:ROK family protein n=1 Tax=Lysobacter korlensis TaxID=553636 RepID=A0ABV6RVD9_9GAMM